MKPGPQGSPSTITVICPRLSCRAILRVPASVRGKRVRCGECGTAFLIPDQSRRSAPAEKANQRPG
jgi:hypothetical protein